MDALRTPDECFAEIPDYPFLPNYVMVDDTEGGELRMHYVDEGRPNAPIVLMLHGEPSWSFLYRKMIPIVVSAGYRAVVPDLIGFGRSDKPVSRTDYTFQRHVGWVGSLLDQLRLDDITLVCQDWGGMIGLRLVGEQPERFSRVVAANTGLMTGDHDPGEHFLKWRNYSQSAPEFNAGNIVQRAVTVALADDVVAAYNAPFPDDRYKAGARQFPTLVPITPDDPASGACRAAWGGLMQFRKPFLTAFSDKDPVTAGGSAILRKLIPGCSGQAHTTIVNGGHFLQEDQGEQFARVIVDFMRKT